MKNKIGKLLLLFLFFESLSLYAFLTPSIMPAVFVFLLLAFLVLAVKDFEKALLVLLAEIFIGSFGYLFWIEISSFKLSIRIALWSTLMIAWLCKALYTSIKNKKVWLPPRRTRGVVFLGAVLVFAVFNGFFNNEVKNVVFDANAWFYFLLIFPVYEVFLANKGFLKKLGVVFFAAVTWLSFKTFVLLYVFSHQFSFTRLIYEWVRDTRVGEITRMEGDFYRIFIQSHIFILIALLLGIAIFFSLPLEKSKNFFTSFGKKMKNHFTKKRCLMRDPQVFIFLTIAIFLSVTLLNFSRSNWLGLFFALLVFLLGAKIFFSPTWKNYFLRLGALSLALLLALFLIFAISKFPLPNSTTDGSASTLLKDRAKQFAGEAGVSSRWNLLDELKPELLQSPILGQGFGATVTYISNDPRIRAETPSGEYTTFAFEWGWLDIWIKTGALGFFAYLALIFAMLLKSYRIIKQHKDPIIFGLALSLIALSAINFFSPYLNHPLGITFIILCFSIFYTYKKRIHLL